MGAIAEQVITDRYAVDNGDCLEVLPELPDGSIHHSIYSPPFWGLYHYTSNDRDLSNNDSYERFLENYRFVVREIERVTMPGRITAVHCTDIRSGNTGRNDYLIDFPGDIIRLHDDLGFRYVGRYHIWKDALKVRNRTLVKGLAHMTIVEDSVQATLASADYLLAFRKKGDNPVPVTHPHGFTEYAGATVMPADRLPYRNWDGDQKQNRFSHWIWQRYAAACWEDVRLDRVLPFEEAEEDLDEKHPHPLQLDVIDRALAMWTNPGERVLSPFAGVGSEVYGAVKAGRFGVGIDIKPSYYRQMVKNLESAAADVEREQLDLFALAGVSV
jgi:DNA modification methylase